MRHLNLSRVIVILAITGGVMMQSITAVAKTNITHDESISYLSATVNQGGFETAALHGTYPAGAWVPAGEWKQFLEPTRPLAFRQIGVDLAQTDIHPPLYFWLLHLWTLLFGVYPWTGPSLNIVIFVIGGLGLFLLAGTMLKNELEAAVVTFLWAVSPAVTEVSGEARQYALFGTCAIMFVWALLLTTERTRPWQWYTWAFLVVATAAGALAHYHFALVVAGGMLIFALKLWQQDKRRFLMSVTAVAAGYFLFFVLHPRFYQSFQILSQRQALEARYLSTGLDVLRRIYAVAETYTGFWVRGGFFQITLFVLFTAFVLWSVIAYARRRAHVAEMLRRTNLTGYPMLLFFSWMAGVTILLYLTFISPIHAMTPRHMSAVWPFMPFFPIFLLRFIDDEKQRWRGLAILAMIVLASGVVSVWQTSREEPLATAVALTESDKIMTDALYSGIGPRIFMRVPDNNLLFIASQQAMLADPSAWLNELEDGSVYISDLSYENSIAGRDQILALLEQKFDVVPDEGGNWSVGRLYILRER